MRTFQPLLAALVAVTLSAGSPGSAQASTPQTAGATAAAAPVLLVKPPSASHRPPSDCFPPPPPEPVFVRDEDHGKEFYTGAGGAVGSAIGMFFGSLFAPGLGTFIGGAVGSGVGGVVGSLLYHSQHRPGTPMTTTPGK